MSRSHPNCFCCGAEFNTGGCVIGLRCRCESNSKCEVCTKCTEHHHRNCTPEIRNSVALFVVHARDVHNINIFEYGEVKTEQP